MPGNTQRQESTSADATQRCPDESVLLAYTRQQLTIEQYEEVGRHIQQCEYGCQQKVTNATLSNDKLAVLASVQEHLRYPALWPTLQPLIQQERQRVAVKKLSFVSVSAALILAIVLMAIFVALAYHFKAIVLPSGQGGVISSGQANTTSVVRHSLSPTPLSTSIATVGPSAKADATPTSTRKSAQARFLQVCSTPEDLKQNKLRICGTNFAPGDKVTLIVALKGVPPMQHRLPGPVDAQGTFTALLNVSSCRDLPLAVYALDVTKNLSSSNVLQHIPFEGCAVSGKGA